MTTAKQEWETQQERKLTLALGAEAALEGEGHGLEERLLHQLHRLAQRRLLVVCMWSGKKPNGYGTSQSVSHSVRQSEAPLQQPDRMGRAHQPVRQSVSQTPHRSSRPRHHRLVPLCISQRTRRALERRLVARVLLLVAVDLPDQGPQRGHFKGVERVHLSVCVGVSVFGVACRGWVGVTF